VGFVLNKLVRLSNYLYIYSNFNHILISSYNYYNFFYKSYVIIFFGLVVFHIQQRIYTKKIKKIQLYMQKMIWTPRESVLPLLVHSIMHLPRCTDGAI
jgi:hypothetical protein